jgi:uncharacterized protein YecE (DUF72 family)
MQWGPTVLAVRGAPRHAHGMALHVGTSGWQYDHWRGRFYPDSLRQDSWLPWFAERFATVESNSTFYRLPARSSFERWADRTPEDFVIAVKVSRYLTHVKRLGEPREPVERFLERARGLGLKLGPVLLQLPPHLHADTGRLRATLEQFPPGIRVAVEFRHDSWWTSETEDALRRYGAALCHADRRGPKSPNWVTAVWGYLRFHQGAAAPPSCYGRAALATWVQRIGDWWSADADVFAYFNNDGHACALANAVTFARLASRAGLHPTRVPDPRSIRVD